MDTLEGAGQFNWGKGMSLFSRFTKSASLLGLCCIAQALNPSSAWAGISCPSDAGTWDIISNSGEWITTYTVYCERTFDGGGRGGRHNEGGGGPGGGGAGKGDEFQDNPGISNIKNLNAGKTCPVAGNPVTLATGNKIESETDFGTAGEMALHLERTYNKFTDAIGLFGYNWISNFDYQLGFGSFSGFAGCYARPSIVECTTGHTYDEIYSHRPDGRIIKFTKDVATGIYWEDKPSPVAKMARQANGNWLVSFEDNISELYSPGGYPLWIEDEHGLRWTYTYGGLNGTQVQRVTHSNGRHVQFFWVEDELREIRDPAGTPYTFSYTNQKASVGFHTLKTTVRPGSPSTVITYHYSGEAGEPDQSPGGLTGKSFNGVRYSRFTYDTSERATSTQHAGGVESNTFDYTVPATGELTVTHTNPLGKRTVYDFKEGRLVTVTGQASALCPATGRGNSYDSNGYPNLVTDNRGYVTDYDYSATGQLRKKIEAKGTPEARTTVFTWDTAKNRITRVTVIGDSQTDYTFTPENRLASVKVTNLSGNGVANQTRTTAYTYTNHANGLLATMAVDGPLPDDTVTSTYSQTGDLLTIKNGLGHTTTYSNYNALGQPGRVTSPNGAIAENTYDARGRIIATRAIVNGIAQTTTYTYDGAGRLATITTPDNVTLTREYDAAGRVLREYQTEAGGTFAVKRYTHNNASQVTSVTVQRTSAVVKPVSVPALSLSAAAPGDYTLAWTASSGTEYYVLEERAGSGSWTQAYTGASRTKSFSGKPAGTYSYRAKACNAEGCTGYSSEQSLTVAYPPSTAPVVSTPSADNNGAFTVTWSSSALADEYRLQQRRDGGTWTSAYLGGALSKALSGLSNGAYDYRVIACNEVGCSSYSAIKTTVVTHPPSTPSLTVPAADNNGAFTATWGSVSTANRYDLVQRKNGGSWVVAYSGTALSKAFSGLTNGTYDHQARACNVGGCSPYTASRTTVVTFPPSSAPTLTAPYSVDTYEDYTLSWTAVSTATTYQLQSSFNGGEWTTVHNGSARTLARNHAHESTHRFQVRACNAGGCGPFSAIKTVYVIDVGGGGPCHEGVCPEPK